KNLIWALSGTNFLLSAHLHHCVSDSFPLLFTAALHSSASSEVACDAIFASICTFSDCARPCGGVNFRRRNDATDRAHAGSTRTDRATTAQFLVIGLWRGGHVVQNKASKTADFWWTSKASRRRRKPSLVQLPPLHGQRPAAQDEAGRSWLSAHGGVHARPRPTPALHR